MQTREVLENPVTGERLRFRRTAADTGGEVLEYELTFRPQGFLAQEHLHPSQSERHEVLEGKLGMHLDGVDRVLEPGDVVTVPAATPHRLFPVGEGQATCAFELRPALRTQQLLELFYRLGAEGKLRGNGMPGALQLALIAEHFEPEGYATKPPLSVQHLLFRPLASLARRRGYTV